MNREGKKIKKLYDSYLVLKAVVEETAFLTEDGILVELELVRAGQAPDRKEEEQMVQNCSGQKQKREMAAAVSME